MKMHGVIAPSCLCKGLFTVGAIDNLDHNPSSTTSTDSFRGTGISLFQFPAQVKQVFMKVMPLYQLLS